MRFNLLINICILILSSFILFKVFHSPQRVKYALSYSKSAELPLQVAQSRTRRYRSTENVDTFTHSVVYGPNDLEGYIENNFNVCTEKVPLSGTYAWKVGLCPMHTTDTSHKIRLDIGLVPVIVDETIVNGEEVDIAYDYFECRNNTSNSKFIECAKYYADLDKQARALHFKSFFYNEGHLYP